MMATAPIKSVSVLVLACFFSLGFALPTLCSGGTIEIEFTGVDIAYDGTDITDADPSGGEADPLLAVAITQSDIVVGSIITEGISQDLFIPKISGISAGGGSSMSAAGGSLDLALGSGHQLQLDLAEVDVTYVDLSGTMQFVFAATVGGVEAQNLPYDLEIGQKLGVSFSTQVSPGSLSTSGGVVTAFKAAGSGEVEGAAIPEPTGLVLLMLAIAGACSLRHQQN